MLRAHAPAQPTPPVRRARGPHLAQLRVHVTPVPRRDGGGTRGRGAQGETLAVAARGLLLRVGGAAPALREPGGGGHGGRGAGALGELRHGGGGVQRAGARGPAPAGARRGVSLQRVPLAGAGRALGGQVVTVRRPPDGDWTRAVLAELDERAALVALPHCHWTDGSLVDLERVGVRAREVGAALVVDATQSLGALPLSVERVRPDFLVTAGYKWMMGPYSLGYLYVAPRWREGRPLEHNWLTRAGSEDFSRPVDYRDDFQPGARRFDVGERSNFALVPMALAALRQLSSWGVADIQETVGVLTARLAAGARSMGLEVAPEGLRAGHLMGLRNPGGYPPDVTAKLAARRVFVSVRGDSLRVSPHLYNTEADVDRLLEELDTFA
ncbi:aminotransferase class V-fold PLP-dependent enzyme [Cystobacter fuscus]